MKVVIITKNSHMLYMIVFLPVARLIGFMLFQTTSNLKSTQQLIHMVQHYQCIKIMHQKQVNQEPVKWILQTLNIIRFKEGKTHLGVNAKQKLFLFYYMLPINILLMILSNNIHMSCLVRTTCFCLVQRGNLIILRRWLFTTCQSKILVPQEHIDCIPDFRVGLTFEAVWFSISRIGCKIPCCQDTGKEKKNANFFFRKKLNALFWADETAKYNYNAFGDVVSLDATFSMNKYDMVFVPFTGIDNHKKCVTFELLSREDAFLKAFKKQHMLFLTDQDPTLNKAVNEITSQVATNSDFRKRFHSIIWDSKLEPHDFDNAWQSCLDEFKISNNKWIKKMYGLRRRWGVMERQRRNQIFNDFNTATTVPRFITSSPNEPHVSKVYTRKIFYQVHKEISDSGNTCFQMSVTSCNGVDTIIVLEKQKNISTMQPTSHIFYDKLEEYHYDYLTKDTQYTVTHSTRDGSLKCTCMHFEHVGLLCRHIFCISENYIMRRWHRHRHFSNSHVDSNSNMTAIEIFSNVDGCVSFLIHDSAKLKSYLEELNKLKKKL
uniref:SWIM-type domain-containing protein n=1 Tax=Lactuca sativa TaxID=4236 RepID=A0A9R1X8T8_LACSA|nr:hypothetical protein LSAT_V11C500244200 [Lactuca sativa]